MKKSTKKLLEKSAIGVAVVGGLVLAVKKLGISKIGPLKVSGILDDISSLFGGDDVADSATDAHGGGHKGGGHPHGAPKGNAPAHQQHAAPPHAPASSVAPGASQDATFGGEFKTYEPTASDLATMLDDSTTAAPPSPGD